MAGYAWGGDRGVAVDPSAAGPAQGLRQPSAPGRPIEVSQAVPGAMGSLPGQAAENSGVAARARFDLFPALEGVEQQVVDLGVTGVDAARVGRVGLVEVGRVELGGDGRLLVLE